MLTVSPSKSRSDDRYCEQSERRTGRQGSRGYGRILGKSLWNNTQYVACFSYNRISSNSSSKGREKRSCCWLGVKKKNVGSNSWNKNLVKVFFFSFLFTLVIAFPFLFKRTDLIMFLAADCSLLETRSLSSFLTARSGAGCASAFTTFFAQTLLDRVGSSWLRGRARDGRDSILRRSTIKDRYTQMIKDKSSQLWHWKEEEKKGGCEIQ